MRIENTTHYVADDGTHFGTEKECMDYEEILMRRADFMLKDIPHKVVVEAYMTPFCGSHCYGYLFLHFRNTFEAERANLWYNKLADSKGLHWMSKDTVVCYVSFRVEYNGDNDEMLLGLIDNVDEYKTIEEFAHELVEETYLAEHYVKYDFEKENTK